MVRQPWWIAVARLGGVLRRRWGLALAAVLFVLALVLVFVALPALVRWRAAAMAERWGVEVTIDGVRPGWKALWLRGVEVTGPKLGLHGRLHAVKIGLGLSGAKAVEIHGGEVRVRATRQALVDALPKRQGGGAGTGARRSFGGKGLFLEWKPSDAESLTAHGFAFDASGPSLELSSELAELHSPYGSVRVRRMHANVARSLEVERISADGADVVIELDRVLEVVRSPEGRDAAPGSPASSAAGGANDATPPALEPAAGSAVLPGPLSLDPKRAERIQGRVRWLAGLVARRLPEGSALDLSGLVVRFVRESGQLSLGPAQVRIAREPSRVVFSFVPAIEAPAAKRVALTARLPIERGETEVELEGGPVRLSALGVKEGNLGFTGVDQAELRLEAKLVFDEEGRRVVASSSGQVEKLALMRRALGPLPLSGLALGWDVRGSLQTDGSELGVESGELGVGAVRVQTAFTVKQDEGGFQLEGRMNVPLESCSKMLTSLPENLVPFASSIALDGTFSWSMVLSLDSRRLADLELDWKMQNDCRFEKIPENLSPERFRGPFSRQVPGADGEPLTVVTGPGSEDWVPLPEVSTYLEAAVLVSEDGRFWSHRGFDQRAIESSIRQNLQAGRFMRGASTISMQLAKNLYLTREKTLSRKVQEALLTMLLEQVLRKDEILELYLNVVELGPGIYGIKRGAEHYFKSPPSELSVAQCFFLISMLPSPSSQHFDEAGNLKPHWRRYIDRLMRISHERGRLTDADLEAGLAEEVRFGVPAHGGADPTVPERGEGDFDDMIPF